ncbi:MAG: hypothetical protein D6744_19135 [Planctomycetota bacterium]|nr:MAG: hypothetical protein D6744_19135 [Planctomycetota bacterium]
MKRASQADNPHREQRSSYRPHAFVILAVAGVCAAALVLKAPYQADRAARLLIATDDDAARAAYFDQIAAAGERGRWGISRLLRAQRAEDRQFGVLAAQPLRSEWSRNALLEALLDRDPVVAETAAVALAARDLRAALPRLREMFQSRDPRAVRAACVALAVSSADISTAELSAWADQAGTPMQCAAIIDAAEGVGDRAAGRILLGFLDDDRVCIAPTRTERLARLVPLAALAPYGSLADAEPVREEKPPPTIAERAADALARITGFDIPFRSDFTESERHAARRVWERALANPPP